MKKIKQVIYLSAFLLILMGCDKNFVEINTNPFAINTIEPGLLLAGTQRTYLSSWDSENTIVQQFVIPYNLGATLGFNFNYDIDGTQNGSWGSYTGAVKTLTQILYLMEGTTDKVNLKSIARIWKAQVFMDLVDHYGNVPYFGAGFAAIKGEAFFFPVYDDASAIYDDLYKELKEAIADLNPSGDWVSADLFYGAKAYYPTADAAGQVAKWKKLGNSLLLRLGMRYTKLNPTKAASIVSEAFNGGVMTSNTDNAFVVYDGTLYTNGSNAGLINNNPRFYYAAEPFVDQLKSTNDPRGKYIVASFVNPNDPLGDPNPDTDILNQFGVPVGIQDTELDGAPYRGIKGGGLNYSQMNVNVMASISAPTFWVTYAQTSLLLAEAAHRGWISGGESAAQTYYENGIKADMDHFAIYLTRTGSALPQVSVAEYNTYLSDPAVAYNSANALELINTQYWIACIGQGSEAWANFRRVDFPALDRNAFDDQLLQNGGDGYVHRFTYPDAELSNNKANYQAAVANLTGSIDDVVNRIFWDKQ